MAYEVDRLEIVIETATEKTSKALDVLIRKLNTISTKINDMSKFVDKIGKLDKKMNKTTSGSKKSGLGAGTAEAEDGFNKLKEALYRLDPEYQKIIDKIKQTKQYQDLLFDNQGLDEDQLLEVLFKRNTELGKALGLEKNLIQETERLNKLEQSQLKNQFKDLKSEIVMSTDKVKLLMEELRKTKEFKNIKELNPQLSDPQIIEILRAQNAEVSKLNGLLGRSNKGARSLARSFAKVTSTIYLVRKSFSLVSNAIGHEKVTKQFRAVFAKLGRDSGEAFSNELLDRAENFIESYSQALSLNKSEMMNYMSTFAQMTSAMGLASETVYMMSESLTALGGDMASFFADVESTDDAMTRLRAGLSGQIRPMRRLGIDITKTTLAMIAHKHGIEDSLETMSAASKTQLRYLAIIEQMTITMGDASKSVNNSANEMNAFKGQVKELGIAVGQMLMPVFKGLLTYATAIVIALKDIAYNIAALFGYQMPDFDIDKDNILEDTEDDVEDLEDAVKNLQATLGGFDELNILSQGNSVESFDSGYAELDDAIAKAYEEYTAAIAKNMEQINNRARELADNLKPVLEIIMKVGVAFLAFKTVFGLITKFKIAIELVTKVIGLLDLSLLGVGKSLLGVFGGTTGALIAGIAALLIYMYSTNENFRESVNSLLSTFIPIFQVVGELISKIFGALEPLLPVISRLITSIGDLLAVVLNVLTPILDIIISIIVALIDYLVGIFEPAIKNFGEIIGLLVNLVSNHIEALVAMFKGVIDFIVGVFTGDWEKAWDGLKQIFQTYIDFFKNIWLEFRDFFVNIFANMGDLFVNMFEHVWENIKSFWARIKNLFKDILDFVTTPFVAIIEFVQDIFNADNLMDVFKAFGNLLLKGINNMIGAPFELLNNFLQKLKDVNILGVKPFGWVPTIPVPEIPMLAGGGILNEGQMFVAREAGAELVGNFGGSTGVMNNDQIVESVSRGVANAVAQVMDNGSGSGQNINVYLDGNQITNAVEQNKIRRGVTTLKGGRT